MTVHLIHLRSDSISIQCRCTDSRVQLDSIRRKCIDFCMFCSTLPFRQSILDTLSGTSPIRYGYHERCVVGGCDRRSLSVCCSACFCERPYRSPNPRLDSWRCRCPSETDNRIARRRRGWLAIPFLPFSQLTVQMNYECERRLAINKFQRRHRTCFPYPLRERGPTKLKKEQSDPSAPCFVILPVLLPLNREGHRALRYRRNERRPRCPCIAGRQFGH